MATQLKSKPGLSSTTTLSIPKDWDPTWFRHFINNQLKGADVRNAQGINGITISGTIASPYATISASGLISSVVGTANEIAVSTAGGVATLSFAPNVVIPAPPSGAALTVDGVAGNYAQQIVGNSSSGNSFGLHILAGTTSGDAGIVVTNAANTLNFFEVLGDGEWFLGPNAGTRGMQGAVTGAVSFFAPSSGNTITIQSNGGNAIVLNNTSGGGGLLQEATGVPTIVMNSPGADFGMMGSNGTQTWYLGYGTSPIANGTAALQWNASGNVSIPAPSSGGSTLEIDGGTILPLLLTTTSSGPWALEVARNDVGNTLHVFNAATNSTNGYWYFNEQIATQGKNVLYSNDAALNTVGGKVSSQSGGTASGGNAGDIILIY